MTHIVQFSGGKDSTALVLWAKDQGWPFTAVFCDTKHEHPATYAYIDQINRTQLDGALVTVCSAKYPGGMGELVRRKGRVPSTRARFCTEELKVFPFRDWLRQQTDEAMIYQGIRGDESGPRRAAGARLWSDVYDSWIERPLFDWSADDVFAIHKRHGVEPNPLYLMGASRVGCFPCIMVNHGELKRMGQTDPLIWERAANLERAANRTFFPPHYIPARACSVVSRHIEKFSDPDAVGGPHVYEREVLTAIPTVEDVKRYILSVDENQIRFWDRCDTGGCLSVYNLCE